MNEKIKQRKGLARTGRIIELPENITWLKQSNFVTLMSYDYSVVQLRALIAVIERVQDAIESSIKLKGREPVLGLFPELEGDKLKFSIPIKEFGVSKQNYDMLKDCLSKLSTIPVVIDIIDPDTGKDAWYISGLMQAIVPKKYERNVKIFVEKDVAKMLINVEKGFTKYIKEIAYHVKSKYTARIYFLISSWKDKGGFSITIPKFRKWLNLTKKYSQFKSLYWDVIRPAYEELFERADCWFEVAEVYREGEKEPYKLNFKVIKGKTSDEENKQFMMYQNSLNRILTERFFFDNKQANEVLKLLTTENYSDILMKLDYLNEYTQTRKIKDKAKYIIKALKVDFGRSLVGEEPLSSLE